MWHLARAMALRQVAALTAVVLAVLGGAALLTAAGVLAESGWRSHLPPGRLAGADVVVSASQEHRPDGGLPLALPERRTVPGTVVDRLAALPGVAAAVGDVSFPAALLDGRGRVVPADDPRSTGHAWSSIALWDDAHVDGGQPRGPDEVAVERADAAAAGVQAGDRVTVVAVGRPSSYRVAGVVDAPGAGLLFDDGTAAGLAATNRGRRPVGGVGPVDLVALRPVAGADAGRLADAVRAAVAGSGLQVTTGAARGDVVSPAATASRSLLTLLASSLAGIVVIVVGFVVAGAMGVSVQTQRPQLALLRAVGATPRQVRRLVAAQAVAASLVGLAPGLVLGHLLAARLQRLLVELGTLPAGLPLTTSPLPALATTLLLGAAVHLAALGAARRISRSGAVDAVAHSRSEPRTPSASRGPVGLLVVGAASILAVVPLLARSPVGAAATPVSGMVAALGLAVAGPPLLHRASGSLARHLPRRASAATWLAAAGLRGQPGRAAGLVTALAMAVTFTLTYVLTQTTVASAASRDVQAATLAQHSISAAALGGLPGDVLDATRRSPGVVAAAPVSDTTVLWTQHLLGDVDVESHPALVLTPAAAGVLDLDVRAGRVADLRGPAVAVSEDLARTGEAGLGRTVSVLLADGARRDAKVVAVYARGLGLGPVVVAHDLAAGHTGSTLDQRVLVRTDGTPATRAALRALVDARAGLRLDDTGADGPASGVPAEAVINLAVIAVLLAYLLLGLANRLWASTVARRDELALLHRLGMTRRQIRAMVRREAALTSAAAVVGGTLLAVGPLALLGQGLLSRPWPAGPLWLLPAAASMIVALTGTTTALATRRALRPGAT